MGGGCGEARKGLEARARAHTRTRAQAREGTRRVRTNHGDAATLLPRGVQRCSFIPHKRAAKHCRSKRQHTCFTEAGPRKESIAEGSRWGGKRSRSAHPNPSLRLSARCTPRTVTQAPTPARTHLSRRHPPFGRATRRQTAPQAPRPAGREVHEAAQHSARQVGTQQHRVGRVAMWWQGRWPGPPCPRRRHSVHDGQPSGCRGG